MPYLSGLALLAVLMLSGCATTPDAVRDADVEAVSVEAVRQNPAQHIGSRVRWGGTIIAVENAADTTLVEIISRPLRSSGTPLPDAPGEGRFRARVPGFLDPSDYAAHRWMTVVGVVTGTESGKVGDFAYTFPVVAVEHHKLWRKRSEVTPSYPAPHYYYSPWWWDPWYPGYPYRYPYRHPYWW